MSRIDDWHAIFNDPHHVPLAGAAPEDGPLFDLMVHLAYADGELVEDEFELMRRASPGMDDDTVLHRVEEARARTFDFRPLLDAFPSKEDRRKLVLLGERMALDDHDVTDGEVALLARLRFLVGED